MEGVLLAELALVLAWRFTEHGWFNGRVTWHFRRLTAMNAFLHRLNAKVVVALGFLLLSVGTLAPRAEAEEWTKSYPVSGRAQVRVDTNDGAVQIYTGSSKQVDFRVLYDGYEINRSLHVDSRQEGDSVQINARVSGHWGFSWGNNHRNIRIEVHMPKDADLQIDTGDGSVTTQSLNGKVKIHTGDGAVRAQEVSGDLDIDTGDGSITVEGAKGEIRLRTGWQSRCHVGRRAYQAGWSP
jgi:hypothetical protein